MPAPLTSSGTNKGKRLTVCLSVFSNPFQTYFTLFRLEKQLTLEQSTFLDFRTFHLLSNRFILH